MKNRKLITLAMVTLIATSSPVMASNSSKTKPPVGESIQISWYQSLLDLVKL